MITVIQKPLTFEEFLAWDDGSDRDFELINGFPMPVTEPNANHEDVADNLCDLLSAHCRELNLPYVPKRSKQVRLKTAPGEREKSRKADLVIFAKDEWQRLKASPSSAAAYIPPPMVIEIASNNWKDDYLTKLGEYEDLGIPEYWIVDYAALGAVRYIGSPKQPTITIYHLVEAEYQPQKFQGNDQLVSQTFPQLALTARQVLST